MELGKILVFIISIALFIEIAGFLSIPEPEWQRMSAGQQFLLGFNLLVSFLLLVFAYWIHVDGREITRLTSYRREDQRKIRQLEEYTEKLELLRIDFRSKISEGNEKKLESMFDQLVAKYKANGFLNPRLVIDGKIAEKIALRKTIEEAIKELYDENLETK